MVTYPCWDYSSAMLAKGATACSYRSIRMRKGIDGIVRNNIGTWRLVVNCVASYSFNARKANRYLIPGHEVVLYQILINHMSSQLSVNCNCKRSLSWLLINYKWKPGFTGRRILIFKWSPLLVNNHGFVIARLDMESPGRKINMIKCLRQSHIRIPATFIL